jgi:hypothetical protein
LYGHEKHGLRMFESRVLRKMFGPKRDEITGGAGENCMKYFTICTLHQILG